MAPPPGMPVIDTSEFQSFHEREYAAFQENRDRFVCLIYRVIGELGLENQIEHLTVRGHTTGRAMLYRNLSDPWPSKRLNLDLYFDRFLDRKLLTHEFGHEADRRDPSMLYDPEIEERWKEDYALEIVCNLSLDSRLGSRGLGKECRLIEFRKGFGDHLDSVFEVAWARPPASWPEMEELALKLRALSPLPNPTSRRRELPKRRRARPGKEN